MNRFAELHEGANRNIPAPDRHWEARRRLADKVRALIERVNAADALEEAYGEAIASVEGAISALASAPHRAGLLANTRDLGIERFVAVARELNPIYGLANPLSPPLEMRRTDDRAYGRVRFGASFEGPPGHVHGGFIAAVFDQFLGFAQTLSGVSGMTGKLSIRYVRPTPLGEDLELEGWVKERVGRIAYLEGVLGTGGAITAKAQAMFVEVPEGYLSR